MTDKPTAKSDDLGDVKLDITDEEADALIEKGKEAAQKLDSEIERDELWKNKLEDIISEIVKGHEVPLPTFPQFAEACKTIILAKSPKADSAERGRLFRIATGVNINQAWAEPGGWRLALVKLWNRTPEQAEAENKVSEPKKPAESPLTPRETPKESKALSLDEIRRKYTMDYRRKDKNTGEITHSDYFMVAGRIMWFRARAAYTGWSIRTEFITLNSDETVMRAEIWDANGVLRATGHARCTTEMAKMTGGRHLEKAETNAVGRALGNLGIGSEEFIEDEKDGYIADSPALTQESGDEK